jgi:hypothetical protein
VISLLQTFCPSPQLRLHWLHELKADTTQSTGQPNVLQFWVAANAGHATPPWATFVTTLRERL